ncbi:MAG: DEAD-like helicase [Cenarchaeum symbiont of Oopsacas minuta]|nr:DEAD-like helicase [Cenarchaeum symbiont of Oopsacas minuta]
MRSYQKDLASDASAKNTLIVLPTGLGKTIVALHVISDYLQKGKASILFLAPTRVLVKQHTDFLLSNSTIMDVGMITGEDTIEKRRRGWSANSIICATPEITRNDLARGIAKVEQFGLVIFDEAHRTIGDYAYAQIASMLTLNTKIIGMTATLPSENIKAKEITEMLRIQKVAFRNEQSPDVMPYIQKTNTEWIKLDLPQQVETVRVLVKKALQVRYDALQRCGVMVDGMSLSALLRQRPYVLYRNRRGAKPLFMAIRITYALNILEAHGITPFLKFCERSRKNLVLEQRNYLRTILILFPQWHVHVRHKQKA